MDTNTTKPGFRSIKSELTHSHNGIRIACKSLWWKRGQESLKKIQSKHFFRFRLKGTSSFFIFLFAIKYWKGNEAIKWRAYFCILNRIGCIIDWSIVRRNEQTMNKLNFINWSECDLHAVSNCMEILATSKFTYN